MNIILLLTVIVIIFPIIYLNNSSKQLDRVSTIHEYVTVDLKGGLGNQLFQLCAAYAYSEKYNKKLVQDTRYPKLNCGPVRRTYWNDMFSWVKSGAEKKIWHSVVTAPDTGRDVLELKNGNVKLESYFQNDVWINEYKSKFKALCIPNSVKVPYIYPDGCVPVMCHIRRTDMITANFALSKTFYQEAFQTLLYSCKGDRLCLMIFSDDIEWCKTNVPTWFSDGLEINYVEEGDETVQLHLMTTCQHFIVPNSTYSWWGAYWGEKVNSKVISTSIWDGDGPKPDSFFPKSWTILDKDFRE